MRRQAGVCALIAIVPMAIAAWAQQTQGDAARGERVFEECSSCHTVKKDAENGVGPNLFGIFDRKAADVAGFRFSPALRNSGIVWTAATLDEFIADPQKMVPANRMPYEGKMDPQARADLIAYLRQATKE